MTLLKCKGDSVDPTNSSLALLHSNIRSSFSERWHKWSTQVLTSGRCLRMSLAAQLCPEEDPHSSLLLLSYVGPHAVCTRPHFPLLQPTRNLPLSLHTVLFWLTWLAPFPFLDPVLPHWPTSLHSAMVHSEADSWGSIAPCYAEPWVLICCFRNLTRLPCTTGSTSRASVLSWPKKEQWTSQPTLRGTYVSFPLTVSFLTAESLKLSWEQYDLSALG